jgi:hypothetical protein
MNDPTTTVSKFESFLYLRIVTTVGIISICTVVRPVGCASEYVYERIEPLVWFKMGLEGAITNFFLFFT